MSRNHGADLALEEFIAYEKVHIIDGAESSVDTKRAKAECCEERSDPPRIIAFRDAKAGVGRRGYFGRHTVFSD